jgi:hypothetical protein
MTTDRLLFAAYALAGKVWTRVCLIVLLLPRSCRSHPVIPPHTYRED